MFIVYAALFDVFDGIVARLLHSSSDFGVELDSLSDVISFGVAPSYLLYAIYFNQLNGLGIAIASLIMVFSAIRLARFNVELVGFDKDKFYGIPTPLSAITLISYILLFHNKIINEEQSKVVISSLAILLPVMMVSKFQYPVLPKINIKSIKQNKFLFSGLLVIILISLLTKGLSVFPFCIIYVISGIVSYFFRLAFPAPKKQKVLRKKQQSPS